MAIRDVLNDNPDAGDDNVLDMEALREKYKDDPEMLALLESMEFFHDKDSNALMISILCDRSIFNKKAHLLAEDIKSAQFNGENLPFSDHMIRFTDSEGNEGKWSSFHRVVAELNSVNQTIQPEPKENKEPPPNGSAQPEAAEPSTNNPAMNNAASLGLGLGSILGGLKGLGTSSVGAAANLSKVVGTKSINASKDALGSMQEWRENRKINAVNEAKATAAKLKSNLDAFRSDPEYAALEKKAFQRNKWDEGLTGELNNLLERKPEMGQHIQMLNKQSKILSEQTAKAIELNKGDKEGVVGIYDELDEELADVSVKSGMVPSVVESGQVKTTIFDSTEKSRQDLRSLIERVAEIVTRIKNFFGVGNYDKANPKQVTNLLASPSSPKAPARM